ncbi:MAG TPA: metallophosphoesterase, partial [Rudaea sp.]
MPINIIHLSDIHFKKERAEFSQILEAFLKDLEAQIVPNSGNRTYVVLSGDLAKQGESVDDFEGLHELFDAGLNRLGVPQAQRICVPGNHDVSAKIVRQQLTDHEGVVSQDLDEINFNDYVQKPAAPFIDKFRPYLAFQARFAKFGIADNALAGKGHDLEEGIGIYCANSAFFSSGGVKKGEAVLLDKGRLCLSTRSIASWLRESKSSQKILVMHHPVDWYAPWVQQELEVLWRKFSLVLTGHLHEQNLHHRVEFGGSVVSLFAPALLTDKRAPMGYGIASFCEVRGLTRVKYRQWGARGTFVSGSVMANSNDGCIDFASERTEYLPEAGSEIYAERYYEKKLEEVLRAFPRHRRVWHMPILRDRSEAAGKYASSPAISLDDIISSTDSMFIRAPAQYGLTSLGIFMCLQASKSRSGAWAYVNLDEVKPHDAVEAVGGLLKLFGNTLDSLRCIVLDSWKRSLNRADKIIEVLVEKFPSSRFIILETIEYSGLAIGPEVEKYRRKFSVKFLWSIPKSGVRRVVNEYASNADEKGRAMMLSRIVSDLETLNLPRTMLNCLMLLKVWEQDFEESPVNRAEMLHRVLQMIFDVENAPTYGVQADLKDCEYVLGSFAELLVRESRLTFNRREYLVCCETYTKKMLVDVDYDAILDVLIENQIVVRSGSELKFRFTYWVHYFAAHRMHHDVKFRGYVMGGLQYIRFPEVVEFYTGIDRRRDDAVEQLANDLAGLRSDVGDKCGIPLNANLFGSARWKMNAPDLKKLREDVASGVLLSNLPDSLKDEYADRDYNTAKPYRQEIERILTTYSYDRLARALRAASRALRNSDFATPDLKRKLFSSIMECWHQVATLIMAIAPMLARSGKASFDGSGFYLGEGFEKIEADERINVILGVVPYNVSKWFREDLASPKVGPVIFDYLENSV